MRINIKLSVQWVLKVTLSSCEMQKEMGMLVHDKPIHE